MSHPDFLDRNPAFSRTGKVGKKKNISYLQHEHRLWEAGFLSVAGVDEVGRGSLAGPVIACCCILPIHKVFPQIKDSKALSTEERQDIYETLITNSEIIWALGIVDHQVIDQINILRATLLAMKQAVEKLSKKPDFVLIDGRDCPPLEMPCQALIKGDQVSQSVAAASIIAKVTRDQYMNEMHLLYPQYGFDQHKGYGTADHLLALQKEGVCPIHRRSYAPVAQYEAEDNSTLSLFL